MGSNKFDVFDLPGIGEFQAREGTSTHELAGAVKFWHDKYQSARREGFWGGVGITSITALIGGAVMFYLRSH